MSKNGIVEHFTPTFTKVGLRDNSDNQVAPKVRAISHFYLDMSSFYISRHDRLSAHSGLN